MPRVLIGSIADKRVSISFAALFVNVTARTPCGLAWPVEISQAIQAIHASGGVAVLAHPAAVECRGQAENGKARPSYLSPVRLEQLVQMGLDGLEIYHHRNDALARDYFMGFAVRHNLLVSGGSDDHGWRVRQARLTG